LRKVRKFYFRKR